MSNLENGYCTIQEYEAFEADRYREVELQVDELYMMMFALDSQVAATRAAKKPSRVTDIEQRDSGLYLVRMTLLNADLHPDHDTEAVFTDGYWQREESRGIMIGGIIAETAYLKSYSGDMDRGLQEFIARDRPRMNMTSTPKTKPVHII